jgi:hypothetical protein
VRRGDVAGDGERGRRELRGHRLRSVGVAIGDDDAARARAGERVGERPPDPACRARDDGDSAFRLHVGHSSQPMDFEPTDRCRDLSERLEAFMAERVLPAEPLYAHQLREAGDPHAQPAVMEELKDEARVRGLWNLFLPDSDWGAGLTNAEYAPLCEIMGRSHIAPEACNCNAPDTGNMGVLAQFGTPRRRSAGCARSWTATSARPSR